jgi:hypothetical protein
MSISMLEYFWVDTKSSEVSLKSCKLNSDGVVVCRISSPFRYATIVATDITAAGRVR